MNIRAIAPLGATAIVTALHFASGYRVRRPGGQRTRPWPWCRRRLAPSNRKDPRRLMPRSAIRRASSSTATSTSWSMGSTTSCWHMAPTPGASAPAPDRRQGPDGKAFVRERVLRQGEPKLLAVPQIHEPGDSTRSSRRQMYCERRASGSLRRHLSVGEAVEATSDGAYFVACGGGRAGRSRSSRFRARRPDQYRRRPDPRAGLQMRLPAKRQTRRASLKPGEAVWILQCESGSYRVRLIPTWPPRSSSSTRAKTTGSSVGVRPQRQQGGSQPRVRMPWQGRRGCAANGRVLVGQGLRVERHVEFRRDTQDLTALTSCSPRSSKPDPCSDCICSCTDAETQMPPGSASDFSRAAHSPRCRRCPRPR